MNNFVIILTGILGATLTFYVSHHLKQGSIRASAILSLFVGLYFYLFPEILNAYLTKNIPIVFIGTSFIGMIPSKTKKSYLKLSIAGALFGMIYISKSHLFEGFGGALGALAFIALLTTLGADVVVNKSFEKLKSIIGFRKKT